MRIALAAGALPPESAAVDATLVARLAGEFAAAGHEVLVLAGTVGAGDAPALRETREGGARVLRFVRADRFPLHWQTSLHPALARLVRGALREARPDVLHVHAWRGLSRDLVHAAAREGVPCVLSLHDATSSCLLGTRRLPGSGAECHAPAAANPCLGCAREVAPRTPWIPPDAQFLAQYVYHQDLGRELALARELLVHDERAREHARRFLADKPHSEPRLVSLDASLVAVLLEVYARVREAGAPRIEAAENPYAALLAEASLREWDARARAASPQELGLTQPSG